MMRKTKLETARLLAEAHQRVEPDLKHIFLLTSDRDDDPREPIRLLEILDSTLASDIMPVSFAADPARGVEYPSSIIEMSTRDFRALKDDTIVFRGRQWKIGEELLLLPAGHVSR